MLDEFMGWDAMRVVYGTLGWHVEYLQPAIQRVRDLDKLVFYYGFIDREDVEKKVLAAKNKMIEICQQFDLRYDDRQLNDPFDFVNIVKRIRKDLEKDIDRGTDIALFNISGGTKPMCSAALLVCIFKGIPALYVNEETGVPVSIPVLEADYLSSLTKREREVAEYIIHNCPSGITQSELATLLGKDKSTVNPQVKGLIDKGILDKKDGDDGRRKIITPSEGIELLFQ